MSPLLSALQDYSVFPIRRNWTNRKLTCEFLVGLLLDEKVIKTVGIRCLWEIVRVEMIPTTIIRGGLTPSHDFLAHLIESQEYPRPCNWSECRVIMSATE